MEKIFILTNQKFEDNKISDLSQIKGGTTGCTAAIPSQGRYEYITMSGNSVEIWYSEFDLRPFF